MLELRSGESAERALPKGAMRLKIAGSTPGEIELVDSENRSRSGLFSFSGPAEYALWLKTPIARARLKWREPWPASGSPSDGGKVLIEIVPITFAAIPSLAASAPRRHHLQTFGFGEKMLLVRSDLSPEGIFDFSVKNTAFRHMRLFGIDDDGIAANFPGLPLSLAFPSIEGKPPQAGRTDASIAVYIHLYYKETWPDFEAVLGGLDRPFDLLISLNEEDQMFEKTVQARFPAAKFSLAQNRGRDVAPFLTMLDAGRFDPYVAVCKLHGKLSKKHGRNTIEGDRTRRAFLRKLVHDEDAFARIAERFRQDAALGLVGPEIFHLPPPSVAANRFIGSEAKLLKALHARAGLSYRADECDFFAGTMFWFRPQALATLRDMTIESDEFPTEDGQSRKTLHHALERFFNRAVRAAGFRVETV
jgi:hypothetical protein